MSTRLTETVDVCWNNWRGRCHTLLVQCIMQQWVN